MASSRVGKYRCGCVEARGALTFIWATLPDISINIRSDASLRRKLLYVYSRTSNVIRPQRHLLKMCIKDVSMCDGHSTKVCRYTSSQETVSRNWHLWPPRCFPAVWVQRIGYCNGSALLVVAMDIRGTLLASVPRVWSSPMCAWTRWAVTRAPKKTWHEMSEKGLKSAQTS